MVKNFLKIAGVKNEKEFYKKYPTEESFFDAHPEAQNLVHQKMAYGGGMYAYQNGGEPIPQDYPDYRLYKMAHDEWEANQMPAGNINYNMMESVPSTPLAGLPDSLINFPQHVPLIFPTIDNSSPVTSTVDSTKSPASDNNKKVSGKTINYNGVSIVDYLNAMGLPSDFGTRKQMAEARGITNYKGLPQQNLQLLAMIQAEQQGQQAGVPQPPVVSQGSNKRTGKNKLGKRTSNFYDGMLHDGETIEEMYARQARENPHVFQQESYIPRTFFPLRGNKNSNVEEDNSSDLPLWLSPVGGLPLWSYGAGTVPIGLLGGYALEHALYAKGDAQSAADLIKAKLTPDQIIGYAKKFGKDSETWHLLKSRGMNDFEIAKALKGVKFKDNMPDPELVKQMSGATQNLLNQYGKVAASEEKNLEKAKTLIQVLKDKKLPRNQEVLDKLAELVPNPAKRMELLKGVRFPEAGQAVSTAAKTIGLGDRVMQGLGAIGEMKGIKPIAEFAKGFGEVFHKEGGQPYYAHGGMHGDPGVYADGYSGTYSNGVYFQAGGSYNPTSVDYGDMLPQFAMGYNIPEAMYGMGMMQHGGGAQYPRVVADNTRTTLKENVDKMNDVRNSRQMKNEYYTSLKPRYTNLKSYTGNDLNKPDMGDSIYYKSDFERAPRLYNTPHTGGTIYDYPFPNQLDYQRYLSNSSYFDLMNSNSGAANIAWNEGEALSDWEDQFRNKYYDANGNIKKEYAKLPRIMNVPTKLPKQAYGGLVKGSVHDMSESDIQNLINQGYKIQYL
jgi:hypothetical protein